MFRNTAVATMILVATTAWTQAPPNGNPRGVIARSNVGGVGDQTRGQSAIHQRVEEMGATLAKMHALLKQMQAKTAASSTKDQLTKANLEMWGLMLSDLDKQFEQLRLTTHARDDWDARRSAMYKQAEARAAAARMQAPPAGVGASAPAATAGQGEAPSPATPSPAQPAPAAPAQASPSTSAPASSPN